jgi:alkanesulfonate monooxygenase SsuD/methylene tetrahydromethanopterin reductase-like flavin-dependent oxidoreductase (luciferase family)
MDQIWTAPEKALVASRTGGSIVGSKETVRRQLEEFLERSGADEIMINAMIFDHAARLRSYEIVAEVRSNEAAKRAA